MAILVLSSPPRKRGARNLPPAVALRNVIPGWPRGPGPEPMNTGPSTLFTSLRAWVPGSRAVPAPRNDQRLEWSHPLLSWERRPRNDNDPRPVIGGTRETDIGCGGMACGFDPRRGRRFIVNFPDL